MNIKTNFFEDYVNCVDATTKQNKFLWIHTTILIFIVIILAIIRLLFFAVFEIYKKNYSFSTV